MLAQAIAEYEAMPRRSAERVHLVALPVDAEENAAIVVNAGSVRADVVVQKSLAEASGSLSRSDVEARPFGRVGSGASRTRSSTATGNAAR